MLVRVFLSVHVCGLGILDSMHIVLWIVLIVLYVSLRTSQHISLH